MVAHSFYRVPGGEDRYVGQQMDLLESRHSIELLSEHNDSLSAGRAAGRMIYSRSFAREVERRIAGFHPAVLHLHNVYPALGPAVHIAATRARVPLVMTIHNQRLRCPNGLMFTEGELCRRCEGGNHLNAVLHKCFPERRQSIAYASALWTHRFVLRLESKISMFIAPSAFTVDQLESWGIAPEKIRLVRNFTVVPPFSQDGPGAYGLYVGRLSTEKGLSHLLMALKLAGDPPFRIVGDGPAAPALLALAQELKLRNVRFMGRLDHLEVATQVDGCRYVAMPSLCYESAPLAALEGLARGRPLLVSALGGLIELAGEDRGLTCSPADPKGMSESITRLMDDPDLCLRAGQAAYHFAANELTPDAHLAALESVYRAVA